jgi:hypothetical protein
VREWADTCVFVDSLTALRLLSAPVDPGRGELPTGLDDFGTRGVMISHVDGRPVALSAIRKTA